MNRLILLLCVLLDSVFLYAQLAPVAWRGYGMYPEGTAMFTVMKKMNAGKNIELQIDSSGVIKGTMLAVYKTTLGSTDSLRESDESALQGRYDPVKKLLLLVAVQTRNARTRAWVRLGKPDSVFYRVSVKQNDRSVTVSGVADQALNENTDSEWIGLPSGQGMGMDISRKINMHLLPLRIQLEGDVFSQPKQKEHPAPRKTELMQTIVLDTSYLQLALYDNGYIDGDTATLLLDGRTIIDRHVLSSKAVSFQVDLPREPAEHVLELFANNLGSIPPNTALLVILSGKKRYEITLSSNFLVNSGVKLVLRK